MSRPNCSNCPKLFPPPGRYPTARQDYLPLDLLSRESNFQPPPAQIRLHPALFCPPSSSLAPHQTQTTAELDLQEPLKMNMFSKKKDKTAVMADGEIAPAQANRNVAIAM